VRTLCYIVSHIVPDVAGTKILHRFFIQKKNAKSAVRSWHFVRLASRVTSVAGNTGADTAGSTVAVDSTAGRCTAGCREGCCTAARCTAGRIAVAGSTVAVGSTAEEQSLADWMRVSGR
jgi:hypothetical protein